MSLSLSVVPSLFFLFSFSLSVSLSPSIALSLSLSLSLSLFLSLLCHTLHISHFCPVQESQIAVDNLSDVSEGRRIVLLGLASLFFFSVVPYEDAIHRLITSLASATEYIKVIATTGAVPVSNNLFP